MKQILKQLVHKKHDYFEIYNYKKKDMTLSLYIYMVLCKIFFSCRSAATYMGITKFVKQLIKR